MNKEYTVEMNQTFDKLLGELVSTKNRNNVYLSRDAYDKVLEDVINAKQKTHSKTPVDYRRLQRYDVARVGEELKLISPISSNNKYIKYFVTMDELFDVIEDAHLMTGHGGRSRVLNLLNTKYKNVTVESVMLYLSLCKACYNKNKGGRQKRRQPELDSGPELTTIQKSEDDGELETKFDIADLVNIDHEFTSGDPLAEKTGEDDHHDFQENSRNTIPSAENAMSQQQNKTVISTVTKNSGGIVRKRATAAISTNPKRTKIDTLHSASKDALDLFFDGIKSTMRQFSATDIHQVKAKIFSIVSEVEAKYLDVPEMQTADDFELVKVKEELSDYHVQFCDEEEEERNSSVMEERMIKKEVNNIVSNDPLYMGESSGSGKGKVEEDASNKKVVRKTAFCPVWNCCEDNCSVRFSTERQLQMNTEFQNFTSEEKDAYICSLVLVIGDDCKIERTRVYRLPDSFDGSNVDVCKKMFRSVLNLTNKSITNALSKKSWGEYEFHDTLLAEARARQIVLNRKFQI
ncbi:PREDICTED: uncharacterized protein LOC108559909 isoform X5 [Nicrophorus vespilloides]|uniref:Uncharacterized protein LOC108559909 isoform X5 n=1 Tax=Nicrophorus vespilloides TaxID=110193 RepID=A0ABM1MDY2_NICVS|nr:PREDICTED: uncharacterized protein LOC108559909 isoform X5 [Nicrophorus vespilloides]